ncbi:MAG: Dyp-type peroxidase [Hyphomicrobiaceae bacterium]
MPAQPAILERQRRFARYLTAHRRLGVDAADIRQCLCSLEVDDQMVIGLGPGLTRLLGHERPELRPFPAFSGVGIEVPSTQADLWIWINCDEGGMAITKALDLMNELTSAFEFVDPIDGFKNGETESGLGRELTGYQDGTENPQGEDASAAAIGHDDSSFVAVQTWKHDLAKFASFPREAQDQIFGRRRTDNEELVDAPASVHVKRTAQESFDPEAFVLRRSLSWSGPTGQGMMFVAFGNSFDAFEAQMRRMAGYNDGIIDACFQFSRPIAGGYYWCPPLSNGQMNVQLLSSAVVLPGYCQ